MNGSAPAATPENSDGNTNDYNASSEYKSFYCQEFYSCKTQNRTRHKGKYKGTELSAQELREVNDEILARGRDES